MKHKRVLTVIITALAAAAVLIGMWLYGAFLPDWISWDSCEKTCDLEKDGSQETIGLHNRNVSVSRGGKTIYSTPLLWRVSNVFTEDLDRDGNTEIIMIVWKHGSYGRHRPFWIKRDTIAFSQHVFVFNMREGELKAVWMSSDMGSSAWKAEFDENSLLHLFYTDGYERIWRWEDWGFKLFGEKSDEKLSLIAVGDNIAHTSVYEQAYDPDSGQFVFDDIYDNIRPLIRKYDLAAVNQETIFVNDPALRNGFPEFATPESMGDALVSAGFDIVLSATNHANDMGERGLTDTLSFWKKYPWICLLGIHESPADYENIDYIEKNGFRLALFNYTESLNGRNLPEDGQFRINTLDQKKKLIRDLKKAESRSDLSLCFLHFGEEYSTSPTEEQRELARELIAAGADIIIGSHPHILQPYEKIAAEDGSSGIVYWSLGNFMSHQTDAATVLGGAASLTIERGYDGLAYVSSFEMLPLVCHFNGKETKVYNLDQYSEELAAEHSINRKGTEFTLKSLQEQFDTVIKNSYHVE